MLTWTDWRGNDYTVGDTIVYAVMSGRSCMMSEGIVDDLWEVYRHPDTGRYTRLADGEEAPAYSQRVWVNPDDDEEYTHYYHSGWASVARIVPTITERRARLVPTGRTSRWARYDKGKDGAYRKVTIQITESITKI